MAIRHSETIFVGVTAEKKNDNDETNIVSVQGSKLEAFS